MVNSGGTGHLHRMFRLMECLRTVSVPALSLNQLSVFYYIAAHEGCPQAEIAKATGLTEATVSRIVDRLCPRHPRQMDALGFCRREMDPFYRKANLLFLTPKGFSLIEIISDVISGE